MVTGLGGNIFSAAQGTVLAGTLLTLVLGQ